jgi:hypothetical protein
VFLALMRVAKPKEILGAGAADFTARKPTVLNQARAVKEGFCFRDSCSLTRSQAIEQILNRGEGLFDFQPLAFSH